MGNASLLRALLELENRARGILTAWIAAHPSTIHLTSLQDNRMAMHDNAHGSSAGCRYMDQLATNYRYALAHYELRSPAFSDFSCDVSRTRNRTPDGITDAPFYFVIRLYEMKRMLDAAVA